MNGGLFVAQRRLLGSVFSLQRLRLSGVGRVSVPALWRNEIFPAGFSSTPGWNLPVLQLPGSCFGQLFPSVACHMF